MDGKLTREDVINQLVKPRGNVTLTKKEWEDKQRRLIIMSKSRRCSKCKVDFEPQNAPIVCHDCQKKNDNKIAGEVQNHLRMKYHVYIAVTAVVCFAGGILLHAAIASMTK